MNQLESGVTVTTNMTIRSAIHQFLRQEDLNFLITNRLPRRTLTQFIGWFSKIEQPLVRTISIAVWKYLSDLDLSEARQTQFKSMHDCFTRELKEGARTIDSNPDIAISPTDGIVGACGAIEGTQVIQAKGFPYQLQELLGDAEMVERFRDGVYVTLRLTSCMYHRFHAPADCVVEQVNYISGDTWNVNPIALQRVERLFCKNERAVISARLASGQRIAMVPVAAILVASIRLHFIDVLLHLRYRGANLIPCSAPMTKGQEMGWFQHGSTVIVFAPKGFTLCPGITTGTEVRMGQPLLRLPHLTPAQ